MGKIGRKRISKSDSYLGKHDKKLSDSEARKARKKFAKAFALDLGAGSGAERTIKYARENPDRIFVAVDTENPSVKSRIVLRKVPNLFFVRADALEALKLVESSSKQIINMDNFPFFDSVNELPVNIEYRKMLFSEVFRSLKPGGTLTITTDHYKLAIKELAEAGLKVRTAERWGSRNLTEDKAAKYTAYRMYSLRGAPMQLTAKKPR